MDKPRGGARIADICGAAGIFMVLALFAALTVIGAYSTCAVEIGFSPDNNEHVLFAADSVPLNLAFLLGAGVLLALLTRRNVPEGAVRAARGGALLCAAAVGTWWVLSAKALPGADSKFILDAAVRLAAGDASALTRTDYFRVFPFQLGFLSYGELCARLFGGERVYVAMGLLNVAWAEALYLGVMAVSARLFPGNRTGLLTALLLLCCLQPLFLTTFLYGFLPGAALALWGVYFTLRYIQSGRWTNLPPAALLLALSVLLKKNNWILLIACALGLFLHALRNRRMGAVWGVVLAAGLALLLPAGVQRGYEARAGVGFGPGTPQGAWLVTGASESSFCSGWYGSYTTTVLRNNGFDQAAAKEAVRRDLAEELSKFSGRPRYLAAFCYHKIVSQWNEPAFQCVWSSAAGEHSGAVSPAVQALYDNVNEPGRGLNGYFNLYVELVYGGVALCMLRLLMKKRAGRSAALSRTDGLLILPAALFGAFLYHALFEAKSQYVLVYLPLLLPYAAGGIAGLLPEKKPAK